MRSGINDVGSYTDMTMPCSVLLVDDERDTNEMLATILKHHGFQVKTADSGLRALEILLIHSVDVVVTDYEMPGMNGVELCRELAVRHPRIVPVLLTGASNSNVADEARRVGAYAYLTKPTKLDELQNVLERALEFCSQR